MSSMSFALQAGLTKIPDSTHAGCRIHMILDLMVHFICIVALLYTTISAKSQKKSVSGRKLSILGVLIEMPSYQ